MPTEVEWSYLAGQIDADGSICLIAGTGNRFLIRSVSLYSQDREMLEWIQSQWGGSIYLCGRTLMWRPTKRVDFLKLIAPYLRTKRVQAELAIESSLWLMTPELVQEYVARSKELNGRLPKAFPKKVGNE